MTFLAAAALAAALSAGAAEAPGRSAQMLNLSCVEALVASGHSELAGVFSFITEKDAPAAFADLAVHDEAALKKYVAKLDKDVAAAGGITGWDHGAVEAIVSIYGSPLAETLKKPKAKAIEHLAQLGQTPVVTLDQLTAKRGARP